MIAKRIIISVCVRIIISVCAVRFIFVAGFTPAEAAPIESVSLSKFGAPFGSRPDWKQQLKADPGFILPRLTEICRLHLHDIQKLLWLLLEIWFVVLFWTVKPQTHLISADICMGISQLSWQKLLLKLVRIHYLHYSVSKLPLSVE